MNDMSELLAITRTQAVLLLQKQQDVAGANRDKDEEMMRLMQVQLEETRRLLAQEQAAKKQLQLDLSITQREIEAKDKQIVSLIRRSNGSSDSEKKLRAQLAVEHQTSENLRAQLANARGDS
jgi:hypothetical protein